MFQSSNDRQFFDLIRLAALFYDLKIIENLTAKTMIELRPNIPGF